MKRHTTDYYKQEHKITTIFLFIALVGVWVFWMCEQLYLFLYAVMMIIIFFIHLKYCRLLIENRYNTKVIVENIKSQNKLILVPKTK